jgi:hypothetical protein
VRLASLIDRARSHGIEGGFEEGGFGEPEEDLHCRHMSFRLAMLEESNCRGRYEESEETPMMYPMAMSM